MPEEFPPPTTDAEEPLRPRKSAPAASLRQGLGQADKLPLYRVVELVTDSHGILGREGKIWHSDLSRVRRFGRAVAANTRGYRVMVMDGAGNLLELLDVVPEGERSGSWQGWQDAALPPLQRRNIPAPARPARPSEPPPRPRTPAPVLLTEAAPVEAMPVEVPPTAMTLKQTMVPVPMELSDEVPQANAGDGSRGT